MPYRDADDARRVHLRLVENLTVETPCRESWKRMQGDERVRHCARCSKDVHDLSAMSLEEIAELVERLQGQLCARFYRRPDGRLVTGYCPSTDTARRASRIAGAAVATVGIAAAAALIATPPETTPESNDRYLPVLALEPEEVEEPALEAQTGDRVMTQGLVSFSAIDELEPLRDARAVAITELVAANGTTREAPLMTLESVCSRLNPTGSFEDFEIESFDMVQLPLPGSCGWGRCRNPDRCD